MARKRHNLVHVPGRFAVCKLAHDAPIPPWAIAEGFFSITRTTDELSIVCLQDHVPNGEKCERDWRCIRVAGSMAFTEIGVLASLITPLAQAEISVFTISTFDTDFLLVKESDFERSVVELQQAGHSIS